MRPRREGRRAQRLRRIEKARVYRRARTTRELGPARSASGGRRARPRGLLLVSPLSLRVSVRFLYSCTVTLLVGSLDGFSILLTCGRCTYAPRSQANGKNLSKSKRSRDSFVTVHTHERTSFCPGSYRQILCGGRGPVRPRPRVASVRAAKRDAHPDTSRDRARTALKT